MPHDLVLKEAQEEIRLSALGPLGQALKEIDELQNYALSQNWRTDALNAFLLSTLSASRAKFNRARRYLTVDSMPLKDEIVKAFDRLAESKDSAMQVQNNVDSLLKQSIEERLDTQINNAQQAAALRDILQASVLRGQGRYDEAIALYERGRETLPSSSVEITRELNDTIVLTRALRAQSDHKLAPEQWEAIYRRARESASGEAAWTLALALNEAGMKGQSVDLYKEAISSMQVARPQLVKTLSDQMDGAASRAQTGGDVWRTYFRSSAYTRNDALFDALDYGKGDWSRSRDFLAHAIEMDPKNEKFQYALNKLGELRLLAK